MSMNSDRSIEECGATNINYCVNIHANDTGMNDTNIVMKNLFQYNMCAKLIHIKSP